MSWRWARCRAVPARVLACLTICSLAVACTNQPSGASAMQLTGYRSASIFGTSGAVTVALTLADSEHVLSLVKALPKGSRPDCREPLGLVYRMTVGRAAGLIRGTVISGYECAAAVSIAVPGSSPSWYTDAGCHLARAISRLVPSRAKGTRRAANGCR